MSLTIPVTPGSLPQGFCPSDYQDLLNTFSQHQSVLFPDSLSGGISVSAAKPTDTSRPWLQLDSSGRPIRLYWFAAGAWLSLHPMVPGSTIWWFDALPTFSSFDGGDAVTMTPMIYTGPMWQQAVLPGTSTPIAAQFPITAGTLPSGTILSAGDTGGEEKHVLTAPEANHFHGFGTGDTFGNDGLFCKRAWSAAALVGTGTHNLDTTQPAGSGPAISSGILGTSDSLSATTDSLGHNTMPPFAVGYLLQRTARVFYTVP